MASFQDEHRLEALQVGETQVWEVTLVRGSSATAVPLSDVSSIVMTLKDDDGAVINSRNGVNAKNSADCTLHATSGLFTWNMKAADTPAAGLYRATWVITLTDGQEMVMTLDYPVRARDDVP